jgi:hypothetical protein
MALVRRLRTGIQAYAEDARLALRMAPVEVALGILTAATLSWAIEVDGLEEWVRVAVAALLAFPLIFTTSVLAAAGGLPPARRWMLVGAALLAAGLYGAVLFDHETPAELWRAGMLGVAALLVPTLVPVVMPATPMSPREGFWLYNTRLVLRLLTAYGFAVALMLGLWAAVAAVQELFDVRIASEVYAHIAGALLLGLAPWALAGGIPLLVRHGGTAAEQAFLIARRLGLYLLLPLLAVYVAILYAYTVRIVFVTELPSNLVSPLVLAAGVMWLVAAVVLEPFHWLQRKSGVARIMRVLPLVVLPLAVLGAWAIALRVQQHGMTEFRYARLVALAGLGILCVIGLVRLVRREAPPLLSIPLVFAVLLVPASIGPWSAPAVAKRSQRTGLERELRAAGFTALPARVGSVDPVATRTVSVDAYQRISGTAHYLRQHFGEAGLQGLLEGDTSTLRYGDVARRLGLSIATDEPGRMTLTANLTPSAGIPLPGGGTIYPVEVGYVSADAAAATRAGDVSLRLEAAGERLVISVPGAPTLGASLRDLIERLEMSTGTTRRASPAAGPDRMPMLHMDAPLSPVDAVLALHDSAGSPRAHLVIRHVSLGRGVDPYRREPGAPAATAPADSWRIESLNGLLIVPDSGGR